MIRLRFVSLLLLVCLVGLMVLPLVGVRADAPVLDSGLVGYWDFDGNVLDSSISSNDGTLFYANYGVGVYGECLGFNGSGIEYVGVDDVNLGTSFSISCWFNVDNFDSVLMSLRGDSSHYIYVSSQTTITVTTVAGQTKAFVIPSLSAGFWNNLVIVVDSGEYHLYLNGTESVTGGFVLTGDCVLDEFGRYNDGVSGSNLDGLLDDVRFYNRVLSGDEVDVMFYGSFLVTVSGDAHTTVSPSGYNSVNYGGDLSVSFLPEFGYYVDKVVVDGYVIGSMSSPYVFSNVTEAHTFGVVSKPVAGNELSVASWGSILLMFLVVLCVVLMVVNVGWLVRFVVGVVSFSVVALILSTGGLPFSPYFELLGLLVSVLLMLVAAVKR